MEISLIIHLFATIFMTGVCWFVQIVHYPLFREIDIQEFPKYERKNVLTAYITVPMMTIELFFGLYAYYVNPNNIILYNLLLLGIIWLSTVIYQVPIHLKLMNKASHDLISKLIKTNWIRTIAWTLRSGILFYFLSSL